VTNAGLVGVEGGFGFETGDFIGETVGDFIDETVGDFIGETVGDFIDETVGDFVGEIVGDFVGETVGDFFDRTFDEMTLLIKFRTIGKDRKLLWVIFCSPLHKPQNNTKLITDT
jgi:hypothetical protein